MIAFERLAMLALGELPPQEAEQVEDHVIGCDGCAAVLERLLDLGDRIEEVTRVGAAFMLAGHALVGRLERDGLITRSYEIGPGGQVACSVGAPDLYTRMRLALDTAGVRRIDLLYESPSAAYRVADVPFDAASGEVVFAQPGDYLRTLPTERKTVRLVSVEDGADRLLGEYVLNHTAYVPRID